MKSGCISQSEDKDAPYNILNMLKYFELRIMLTQQENLYYQVNSGRPITFVNKLAATFQNLGFLLEILSILTHDYKKDKLPRLKNIKMVSYLLIREFSE